MKKLLPILSLFVSTNCVSQITYVVQQAGSYIAYGLSSDTKPSSPPNNCFFVEKNTGNTYKSVSSQWVYSSIGADSIAKRLQIKTDSLATALAASNQILFDGKQPLNSNLTTIAGLTATTDNILVSVASAWASRTPAQLKTTLALNNVDNTTDANKPVSSATQTALNLKSNLASPAFTGTPTGIGLPVYGRVTGSNVTTTGQTLVDITGLSVALAINGVYEFEAVLSGSVTAVTTGNQYGIQYSVAGGAIEAQITGALTTTASKTERITALNTATSAYLTTSAQTGGILIKGIVTTGANAGNFTIRHLKNTSGTSTVFINSFLKVTRIN